MLLKIECEINQVQEIFVELINELFEDISYAQIEEHGQLVFQKTYEIYLRCGREFKSTFKWRLVEYY